MVSRNISSYKYVWSYILCYLVWSSAICYCLVHNCALKIYGENSP
uniref:Uncharacterized protein n=1 Tax=Arundo donax TaxID=35708 RepID=A0A0A9FWT8_ARUDO